MIVRYSTYSIIGVIFTIFIVTQYDTLVSQGSLIVANIQGDMSYYRGKNHEIERYNEALFMGKKWDFVSAESLLSPLINISTDARVYELYGDVLYSIGKPSEVVLVYYTKSLEYDIMNLRVEKKIELLKMWKIETSSSWSVSGENTKSSTGLSQSGWEEKSKKLQELKKFSEERWNYIDYTSSPILERDALLESSLEVLRWGKEKRDW